MKLIKIFTILAFFIIYPAYVHAQVINKVVAVVNDEIVTQQDVDQLLAVLYAQQAQAYKSDELLEKMEELKDDILKQIIDDKLVLSRAKELNVRVSEQEIDDKLSLIKSDFPSEEKFYETLRVQGVTVANLKDRYRDQIMMRKIVTLEVKSKVDVLPSEITEYYEKHREEFRLDEKYKVRHIMIKAEDAVGFELAKVEAQDIYDKLKGGQDFSELAKMYSQGPKKEQGGDMGYVGRGEMLEELDSAIFKLKSGEVSVPIKSSVGYHIFEIEGVKHSGYLSLEQTRENIKNLIFQKKLKEKLDEWLAKLRSASYISIK